MGPTKKYTLTSVFNILLKLKKIVLQYISTTINLTTNFYLIKIKGDIRIF